MYPPDAVLFFTHLFGLVTESIEWVSGSSDIVLSRIKHHEDIEIPELAAIAGQTNFDLKVESTYSYSAEDFDADLVRALEKLKALGVGGDLLESHKKDGVKKIGDGKTETGPGLHYTSPTPNTAGSAGLTMQ